MILSTCVNIICTGFFKVLRGANEVGIENIPIAGIPSPNKVDTSPNGNTTNGDPDNEENPTNGAPSLNRDFQMLMMPWIISLLVSMVTHHI